MDLETQPQTDAQQKTEAVRVADLVEDDVFQTPDGSAWLVGDRILESSDGEQFDAEVHGTEVGVIGFARNAFVLEVRTDKPSQIVSGYGADKTVHAGALDQVDRLVVDGEN